MVNSLLAFFVFFIRNLQLEVQNLGIMSSLLELSDEHLISMLQRLDFLKFEAKFYLV